MNVRFIRAMAKARHTYPSLAAAAGVSPATIKRVRQGKNVRPRTAWLIAQALNTTPFDLGMADA